MKVLLNPRSAEAYGQDFLAHALGSTCDLTTLTATNGAYAPSDSDPSLVVSMNLDEKADSEFVRTLPTQATTVAHVHCRYHFYSDLQRANLESALNRVRIGIVPAAFHRDEFTRAFPSVDWRVVHNGVDRSRYAVATEEERHRFRRNLGIDEDSKIVLFTGRLEDAKGLQVLRQFARRIAGTDMLLLVQFPANSQHAASAYSGAATALREICRNGVILHPDTDLSAERPVRFADILITPSLSEVAPLVVLEAFNAGVVVIGTCATPFYDELSSLGIPDTAYTFLPFPANENLSVERQSLRVADSTASYLADKLIQLAEMSPMSSYRERRNISDAAYNAGFSQEQMLASFREIYNEALSTVSGRGHR